jgi:hypothetical protein
MNDTTISWLQSWLTLHANGDWEHQNGVKIESIDNPGWSVSIDIKGTDLEFKQFESISKDVNETDWVICRVKDGKFEGFGDLKKLITILIVFKEWEERE